MAEKDRQELYQSTREDLLKRQLSNNEKLDTAILTLSSAALALSVTFLNGSFTDNHFCLLILAWLCLLSAIAITLVSYHTSQAGIEKQLTLAERYYLNSDESALTERNGPAEMTDRLAYASTLAFIFGVLLLLIYFATNVNKKEKTDVANQKPNSTVNITEGATVPSMQKLEAGASVPRMQIAPELIERGASVPSMQPAQPSNTSPPTPNQSSNTTQK
jgi:cbb3-type cytochrome oxidase subunit 3/cell division protein FtsL